MTTRVVHRVRCRKTGDTSIWVDVKVVDAIAVLTPKGTEILYWVRASDADVCIVDLTGGGHGKGAKNNCSRLSHMELVLGATDSTQQLYVEKLDALALLPPTFRPGDKTTPITDHIDRRAGLAKAATLGKGPYVMIMPTSASVKKTVDNTGLGLSVSAGAAGPSRVGHVSVVTEKGNTDDHTDAADAIPPRQQSWLAIVKPDAINFQVPLGDIALILPKGKQEERDTTVMTTDPRTHEPCPPDNTDPNVYAAFPTASRGANIHVPAGGPIDQGPLWWIERISGGFNPWFWFAQVRSPKAFSYFGSPGRLGAWAFRGFLLWNYYPVIWILSKNNELIPMGSFGSPTLDLCARMGNWDYEHPPVPWGPVYVPPRPIGAVFPFSALSLTFIIERGEAVSTYAPFGHLQMTHPPLGPFPEAVPYGNSLGGNDGSQIWSGKPNIWQLTGQTQPPRVDPTKPWDPFSNPILPPSAGDAETVAKDFRDKWNSAANGHNDFIEAFVGGGRGALAYDTPPGWSWSIPYYSPYLTRSAGLAYYASFRSGIPDGIGTSPGLPLFDFIPATAWTMDVDQLDPATWDTTHLEMYNNPINWFLPFVIPPLLWAGEPPGFVLPAVILK